METQIYNPVYKPKQMKLGSGRVLVITGWTPIERVLKILKPEQYAAVGNLYSATRGINILIRNLLANPTVLNLVLVSGTKQDDNSKSVDCLYDFFKFGVNKGTTKTTGKDTWVINSETEGYIDSEIPLKDITDLRARVAVYYFKSINDATVKIKDLAIKSYLDPQHLWTETIFGIPAPKIYPISESETKILPSDKYGHLIKGDTIAECWVKIIHLIKTTGIVRPTGYDGNWQELIDLMVVVDNEPEDYYFPDPNYLPIDREFLENYIGQILNDNTDTSSKYTYGQRLRSWFGYDQIEQVIQKIIGEVDAASGVMNLWDCADHIKGGSPCLNHIWVRVVDQELSLTATFRSNDMFGAWVANAMGLRALQKYIVDQINERSELTLTIGKLITISQSAHIYDDCWENADVLISQQYPKIMQRQFNKYSDPIGSFIISCDPSGGFIISHQESNLAVTHISPGNGEEIDTITGHNPLAIIREIAKRYPEIQPDHIGYLGLELQKAKLLKEYRQDC